MKQFIKNFIHRGSLFCGLGPVIMAIVYIFLSANGIVKNVPVSTYIQEIFTSTLMAFIAAGISAVYTVDKLAFPLAGLIQGSVLLLDYLSIYLLVCRLIFHLFLQFFHLLDFDNFYIFFHLYYL